MTSAKRPPKLALWRRVAPAALCTAALSIATFGVPGIANAEPREWDIEAYDNCIKANADEDGTITGGAYDKCCTDSGGVLVDAGPYQNKCTAPPAEPAELRPGLAPQPGMTIQTVPPTTTPPPVGNLPTFAPSIG
jgi:hypothetical protein